MEVKESSEPLGHRVLKQSGGTNSPLSDKGAKPTKNSSLLFLMLAFQNLLRKPTRTLLLILAVALGTGAVFASFTVACGIERSMERSFSRMGADLVVVPENTLVNITSALLTVQPTDDVLAANTLEEVRHLDGVAQVSPQTIYRIPIMAGMPNCKANLIAYDPRTDFTVTPWLADHVDRAPQRGDVLCGGCRSESIGEEIQVCNVPAPIYGKLGRSGVGPLDDSFFVTYDTLANIASNADSHMNSALQKHGITAIMVRLNFGATPEQVRFAIARLPGVKVVSGTKIVTVTRQSTTALLGGLIGFTIVMLASSMILVSLLFSAIIEERRREIGLLSAIGCHRGSIMRMLVCEAGFATGAGGLAGIVIGSGLLLVFQHSLVYFLETLHISFAWPAADAIAITALICAGLSTLVGLTGALWPAWRASGEEPYLLIQEGGR
ncbi:MAG: ABC transporter permease [Candidatus Obscuribacterales bacterium]|nr:ABC transporter permease [Candidatus Obscuribacterales bacterium]